MTWFFESFSAIDIILKVDGEYWNCKAIILIEAKLPMDELSALAEVLYRVIILNSDPIERLFAKSNTENECYISPDELAKSSFEQSQNCLSSTV